MTTKSQYKINHFVSDFLLEPWKTEHNSNRGVWLYDFAKNQIVHRSSKIVFSRKKVFTPEMEIRYNELIETPFSRYVESLKSGNGLDIEDWEVQRALHLIFLAQSPRVSQALAPGVVNTFAEFLSKSDQILDEIVIGLMETSNLVRINVPKFQPIFCPLQGIFSIPYQDPGCETNWSYAFGIPITPAVVLTLISKSVTTEVINKMPLWACSVGIFPKVTHLAIPPSAVTLLSHAKIIENIAFARRANQELFENIGELRSLIQDASNEMGMFFEKVPGSVHGKMVSTFPK
jgi:hypothetical protein